MNIAQQMISDCNGFVKGRAYEDLKSKAMKLSIDEDQCDDETVCFIFTDKSRLVFWSGENVSAS